MAYLKMSGFVSANVVRKPATRLYPFVIRPPIKNTRGKIVMDIKGCNYCTLCARKCPTGAITVSKEGKFWQIDRFLCILCGACVSNCMRHCPSMAETHASPTVDNAVEVFKFDGPPEESKG